jgi:uncharacterized protein (DUF2141 family)
MMKLILSFLCLFSISAWSDTINLKVVGTKTIPGRIFIAVFNDPGQFPDKKAVVNKIVPVTNTQDSAQIKLDLPAGDYAISIFLDKNGNGKLDKNFLGIPTERFGFSKNPRILTGAPSFSECEIRVGDQDAKDVEIQLISLL